MDQFYNINNDKIKQKITLHGFDKGFDKDEQKTIILAKANMLIYFSDIIKNNPNMTKEFAKLFNSTFTLKTNSILGTLSDAITESYDLILTNPPYVTSGASNLKDEIEKVPSLKQYYEINAMGIEGLFLQWIVKALKPKGKAFVIVPDGILNRTNDSELRKFVLNKCIIDCIISLPKKAFFTTSKKTYILGITKKHENKPQTDPVFTYLVSNIGESLDRYRSPIQENDLNESSELFRMFVGNKTRFHSMNNSLRCKIQPITMFNPAEHWSVDRWWTKDEKIQLRIEDETSNVSLDEFVELIDDISATLSDYANSLRNVNEENEC